MRVHGDERLACRGTIHFLFKWQSDREETYVYDGTDIVLEFVDADGAGVVESVELARRYLWGPGEDQLLAQEDVSGGATEQVYWAVSDRLGSVQDVVAYDDVTGATTVQAHFVYDSFGNLLTGDPSVCRYTYTAQEFDAETGQYYYDARYYDPATGVFTAADPLSFDAGDANLYRYVNNSPTNYNDPTGLVWPWAKDASWHPYDTLHYWTGGVFPSAAEKRAAYAAELREIELREQLYGPDPRTILFRTAQEAARP